MEFNGSNSSIQPSSNCLNKEEKMEKLKELKELKVSIDQKKKQVFNITAFNMDAIGLSNEIDQLKNQYRMLDYIVVVSQSEDKHEEEKEKCQNKSKSDFQNDNIEKESGNPDRFQEDTSNTLTQLEDTGNSTKHKINPSIQREETLNMTEKTEK
jgi:hypothetical protein